MSSLAIILCLVKLLIKFLVKGAWARDNLLVEKFVGRVVIESEIMVKEVVALQCPVLLQFTPNKIIFNIYSINKNVDLFKFISSEEERGTLTKLKLVVNDQRIY